MEECGQSICGQKYSEHLKVGVVRVSVDKDRASTYNNCQSN